MATIYYGLFKHARLPKFISRYIGQILFYLIFNQ